MARFFYLKVTKGPSLGQTFNFNRKVVNIGRSAVDNDLILNNQSVSTHHARISYANGFFFLQDMGSTNGTTLNGRLMEKNERVKLDNGAEFCVGSICLQFTTSQDSGNVSRDAASLDKTVIKKASVKQSIKKRMPAGHEKINVAVLKKKPVVIAGGCVLILLVFLIVIKSIDFSSPPTDISVATSADLSNEPVALPADGSYGFLPAYGIDSRKDKIIFLFNAPPGAVYLHYTPGFINSANEVSVILNGKQIDSVPVTGDAAGKESVVYLPRSLISQDENRIIFDNTMNPPGENTWGIKNTFIKPNTETACNMDEARRLNELGKSAYDEKSISTGNLYTALLYFSKALRYLDLCEPMPELYPEIAGRLLQVKTEITDQYHNFMFVYKKALKLKNKDGQHDALDKILQLIPENKDPRHIHAAGEMKKLEGS